jgi:hypothetical protein
MTRVAAGGGRFAPAARRGLAHLARRAGDFPTALHAARDLGWEGRGNRVLGDIWWSHGEVARAAEAFQAARTDAEQHGIAGEAATAQTMRAFALAFLDPNRADDELDLAERLLQHADLRATRLNARLAGLIRDAGTVRDIDDRAQALHTEIGISGLTPKHATLELARCFHYAVLEAQTDLTASITRLRDLTQSGDHAYYLEVAHFMADLPLPDDLHAQTH